MKKDRPASPGYAAIHPLFNIIYNAHIYAGRAAQEPAAVHTGFFPVPRSRAGASRVRGARLVGTPL